VDAVVQLLSAVLRDHASPAAVNYLLQHSTGSGKSLTIACLCCHLVGLTDGAGRAFHTVLVVNDRLQLDKQLGDTVETFLQGGVQRLPGWVLVGVGRAC
jgi:type I restriction enzyme R subunit